ncbi:unnamed protein product [Lota lota]
MSAPDLNFRAQVESVLNDLVKVATVELTKLFETRYQAFVGAMVKSEGRNETLEILECLKESDGKAVSCSIGVQVNAWNNETAELSGMDAYQLFFFFLQRVYFLSVQRCPTYIVYNRITKRLLAIWGFTVICKLQGYELLCVIYILFALYHHRPGSPPSSPSEPKRPPLVKAEAESEVVTEGPVGPVCPLFPKQEHQDLEVDPSEPAVSPPPVRPEPQQTNVSTAKADSPPASDGAAVAPLLRVEAWECVSLSTVDAANDLQMKLKRAGRPDRCLVRPCSVQLVNIESVAKSPDAPKRVVARHDSGSSSSSSSSSSFSSSPPLKDLRRHQGLHTGHRLCCYTACSNGVWRLQGVVAHTRDGYPCKVCGKKFKRRKILRRHARFHTGEKPYACSRCSKTFALRKSLRRHARFHTGERPHDCPQCGKSFRLRENLKAHLRFHSGEKPYVCSVCGKTFRIARNLEKHNTGQCGFLVPSFRKIAGLCGHSICMSCLESMVGHSTELPFRCPDCRAYFGKIVEVQKSYVLASIVEDFKETLKQTARKTAKVYCDCCPDNDDDDDKPLAVKTCLKCEVSLCRQHVQTHLERRAFVAHPLVTPLADLPDRKCPQHEDQVLRYYCTTSRRYACNVCALEGKRSALVTDAASALGRRMTEYMDQRFQMIEGKMTESLDSINKLQDNIHNDKVKHKPGDSSLNSVTVILLCLWIIVVYYSYSFSVDNQTLTDTVKSQQARLHDIYSTIAEILVENPLHLRGDHENEAQVPLTLDLGTASPHLRVSGDLRSAELVEARINYPILDTRFDDVPQILSTQCFGPGNHLWIVETEGYWEVAVTHKGIPRKGSSAFGDDAQSWSLVREGDGELLYAVHRQVRTRLTVALKSKRVAVAVDSGKGTIAFSGVGANGGFIRLHEFHAQLTEPVCLGLGLYSVEPHSRARILGASSDNQPQHPVATSP